MGVVIRQSIQSTVTSYFGILIGYLNWAYLIPIYLLPEQVGLLKILRDSAELLAKFSSLGSYAAITKWFPYFKTDKKNQNDIIYFALIWSFIGFVLFTALYLLFQEPIATAFAKKSALFNQFLLYVVPLAFAVLYYDLFSTYLVSLFKLFVPTIIKDLIQRLLLLLLISAYVFVGLSFETFTLWFIFLHFVVLILLISYLMFLKGLSTSFSLSVFKSPLRTKVINFSMFNLANGATTVLVKYVDSLMITSIIGLSGNGIYGVAFLIGNVIEIPQRFISKASYPLLAEAWSKEDKMPILSLYQKTSLNQLIIGSLIFLGIWLNLDDLFTMLPPAYSEGKWVILFIGLAKVIGMGGGNNMEIIITSKYYRFQTVIMGTLLMVVVASNAILIPIYGITGAGLATAISLILLNVISFLFIKVKIGLQPFSIRHFYALAVATVVYVLIDNLPIELQPILAIVIRSVITVIIFGSLILLLKVSAEVNDTFWKIFRRIANK